MDTLEYQQAFAVLRKAGCTTLEKAYLGRAEGWAGKGTDRFRHEAVVQK